jgi:hypothetical protein
MLNFPQTAGNERQSERGWLVLEMKVDVDS